MRVYDYYYYILFIDTVLEKAKSAFHSSLPSHLMCRDEEIDHMQLFLHKHMESNSPGAMYVSGPPGTGKTATLMHLLDQMKVHVYNSHLQHSIGDETKKSRIIAI